jgi:hypothetical protein
MYRYGERNETDQDEGNREVPRESCWRVGSVGWS